MKGTFVFWLPAAVASSLIACGASTSSKKANEFDGGDAAPPEETGGKTGSGGASAGGSGAGGKITGGAPGAGGTQPIEAGPDAPEVDASVDASLDAGACAPTPGDETPPSIVSATKIGADRIALTFSEPVKVEGVDPLSFRLSIGYTQNFEYPQDTTTYEDTSAGLNDGTVEITSLSGDCTDTVVLTTSALVSNQQICSFLELLPSQIGGVIDDGLFLHFSADRKPTVTDTSGNPLVEAAPSWVSPADGGPATNNQQLTGHYPDGPIPLAVSCAVPEGGVP